MLQPLQLEYRQNVTTTSRGIVSSLSITYIWNAPQHHNWIISKKYIIFN